MVNCVSRSEAAYAGAVAALRVAFPLAHAPRACMLGHPIKTMKFLDTRIPALLSQWTCQSPSGV